MSSYIRLKMALTILNPLTKVPMVLPRLAKSTISKILVTLLLTKPLKVFKSLDRRSKSATVGFNILLLPVLQTSQQLKED